MKAVGNSRVVGSSTERLDVNKVTYWNGKL